MTTTVDNFEARSMKMKQKRTKMVFYMHHTETGKNVTAVPITGRKGHFRFAQGFAVLETAYLDLPNLNSVTKYNVTIYHY
ncbi:hypothetical protein MRB53_026557 [Persea americana]|uniref:Uncharacterized protein n=1 Tax=Persea americana TaxID=3435 RepID=A0ACC2LIE1_PERAE|nr:hypothetical protein MRB53_026557 [Persea americana]